MLVPQPLFTTAPQVPLSQGALAEQWMKKGSKRQDWFLKAPERNLQQNLVDKGQLSTGEVLGSYFWAW